MWTFQGQWDIVVSSLFLVNGKWFLNRWSCRQYCCGFLYADDSAQFLQCWAATDAERLLSVDDDMKENVQKSRIMIVRSSGDRNSDSSIGSVMFDECSIQAKTVIGSFSGLALSYSSINWPLNTKAVGLVGFLYL